MDKHLILLVTNTSKGMFTDEGSSGDGLCTVAETERLESGGLLGTENMLSYDCFASGNWAPFILYRRLGDY